MIFKYKLNLSKLFNNIDFKFLYVKKEKSNLIL